MRRSLFRVVLLALLLAAVLPLSHAASSQLSTSFVVNSTVDEHDGMPGDGMCASSGGRCTLRAAVEEAEFRVGGDTIIVPAGSYELLLGERVINSSDLLAIVAASQDRPTFAIRCTSR